MTDFNRKWNEPDNYLDYPSKGWGKFIAIIVIILTILALTGCKKETIESTAKIVGYEINKKSRVWVEETHTKKVEEVKVGSWKEPTKDLLSEIPIKYTKRNNGSLKITIDPDYLRGSNTGGQVYLKYNTNYSEYIIK